jgi:hypothetical protein
MSQQIPTQKEVNQQQQMKKPAEWSMDLTDIYGDGNGQNALTLLRKVI